MPAAADQSPCRGHAVLVCGAETIAGVAVTRALGRAGYVVHAASDQPDALGFRSRFRAAAAVHPPPGSPAFLPWLRAYVRARGIGLIVPSEAVLLAVRPSFAEFAGLLAYSGSPDVVYRGLSKFDVLAALGDDAAHLPPTLLWDRLESRSHLEQVASLGTPLFLKTDGIDAGDGRPGVTRRAESLEEARAILASLRACYRRVVVQGFVPGCGVGAFFLIHRGRVLAEFMHRRLHEVPHTGGVSSLRESWAHAGIREDALTKLKALAWEGVAMMEYRWDAATDRFFFIELNGRFWGSLHLALHAGVDFPRMLADAHFGRQVAPVGTYARGVRCRHTFPKEVQYVWSRWKDPHLSAWARWGSILEFLALSLNPQVRSDLNFPGDRRLYWVALRRHLRDLLLGCTRRLKTRATEKCPSPSPHPAPAPR